jgi:hypothetical protein
MFTRCIILLKNLSYFRCSGFNVDFVLIRKIHDFCFISDHLSIRGRIISNAVERDWNRSERLHQRLGVNRDSIYCVLGMHYIKIN